MAQNNDLSNIISLMRNRDFGIGQSAYAEVQTTQKITFGNAPPQNQISPLPRSPNVVEGNLIDMLGTASSPAMLRQSSLLPSNNSPLMRQANYMPSIQDSSFNDNEELSVVDEIVNECVATLRQHNEGNYHCDKKVSVAFEKNGIRRLIITHEIVLHPDCDVTNEDLIKYCSK